jgi:hypothetical protein
MTLRIVQYQTTAFVPRAGLTAPGNTTTWGEYPLNPDVFIKPLAPELQQFSAFVPYQVPTAKTPHGWEGQQLDYKFAAPISPAQQQYTGHIPEPFPPPNGWFDIEYSYSFAKPVRVEEQQFNAFQPRGVIRSIFPDGFSGQQWDRPLSSPLPIPKMRVEEQQYTSFQPLGTIVIKVQGVWQGYLYDYSFAKKFPVEEQQFQAMPPQIVFDARIAHGWQGNQFDYSFAKPYPITEQPYTTAPEPEPFPPGHGWNGWQFDYKFAVPFPVASQQYESVRHLGPIPPYLPPGAGKRYKPPTDYLPLPPLGEKPNAPFQPIWDRRKAEAAAAIEAARLAALAPPVQPIGPPPLPPLSVFQGVPAQPVPMQPGQAPFGLPTFQQFVPPDPMGLAHRMRETQDISDATAVLRALGLLNDNEG